MVAVLGCNPAQVGAQEEVWGESREVKAQTCNHGSNCRKCSSLGTSHSFLLDVDQLGILCPSNIFQRKPLLTVMLALRWRCRETLWLSRVP